MRVVLGDGVDEVDADAGVERARSMGQQDDTTVAVRPDRAAQGAQRVTNTWG